MKKELIIGLAILLGVVGVAFVWFSNKPEGIGGAFYGTDYSDTATSSKMIVGLNPAAIYAKTTQLVATSSSRVYLAIVNTGTNYVCLNLDASIAQNCKGIYLAPSGGSFEINETNLYTGTITAIANSASTTVTIVEANRR